jgi:hypothetical protein
MAGREIFDIDVFKDPVLWVDQDDKQQFFDMEKVHASIEDWSADLDNGRFTELSKISSLSRVATAVLASRDWRNVSYSLQVNTYPASEFAEYTAQIGVSEDLLNLSFSSDTWATSELTLAHPLYDPSYKLTKLGLQAATLSGETYKALERYKVPYLMAWLDNSGEKKLFLGQPGNDSEDITESMYPLIYPWEGRDRESDFSLDAVSPVEWDAMEDLHSAICSKAVEVLGSFLLKETVRS